MNSGARASLCDSGGYLYSRGPRRASPRIGVEPAQPMKVALMSDQLAALGRLDSRSVIVTRSNNSAHARGLASALMNCLKRYTRVAGGLLRAPDAAADEVAVTEDDTQDLVRHVKRLVVRDESEQPVGATGLCVQHSECLIDSVRVEPDEHHGGLLAALRALVNFADVECREVEAGRLFGDRPAVGEHGPGIDLELDVVEEPERFVQGHSRVERDIQSLEPVSGARMCGDDDRLRIFLGEVTPEPHQSFQALGGVDVLLAVQAGKEIAPCIEPQLGKNRRGLDSLVMMLDHLAQWAPCFDDLIRRQSLA